MTVATNEVVEVGDSTLVLRPIDVTDVDRLARVFERTSAENIRLRFFTPFPKLPSAVLLRLAEVDHACRDALVLLDGDEIVAVAHYDAYPDTDGSRPACEISLLVEDAWQRRGLASLLVTRLGELARQRGFELLVARILAENRRRVALIRKVAPNATVQLARGEYEATIPLAS